jgi:hypothetical protein
MFLNWLLGKAYAQRHNSINISNWRKEKEPPMDAEQRKAWEIWHKCWNTARDLLSEVERLQSGNLAHRQQMMRSKARFLVSALGERRAEFIRVFANEGVSNGR